MDRRRSIVAWSFGKVLRELRSEAGISQEILAERADMDRTYPSLLECGFRTPSLYVLLKLADALKVDAVRMLELTEDRMRKR
jgi:transcriptional regulator with XRE-family HTH domain